MEGPEGWAKAQESVERALPRGSREEPEESWGPWVVRSGGRVPLSRRGRVSAHPDSRVLRGPAGQSAARHDRRPRGEANVGAGGITPTVMRRRSWGRGKRQLDHKQKVHHSTPLGPDLRSSRVPSPGPKYPAPLPNTSVFGVRTHVQWTTPPSDTLTQTHTARHRRRHTPPHSPARTLPGPPRPPHVSSPTHTCRPRVGPCRD